MLRQHLLLFTRIQHRSQPLCELSAGVMLAGNCVNHEGVAPDAAADYKEA